MVSSRPAVKQQVIIATSENVQNLKSRLADIRHTYVGFEGYIIKKKMS